MSIIWLIVLIVYGLSVGWGFIPPLMWWLLVPMIFQDIYDGSRKKANNND